MNLQQLVHLEIIRADLLSVDAHFSAIGITNASGLMHLKMAFVALANLGDFEQQMRLSYKTHCQPSVHFKQLRKKIEFATYLRNKVVAHIHPELIAKAIEWQPTLRRVPGRIDKPDQALLVNLWVLETAINTYVDESGAHKIFESETDLLYPPNWSRFLSFLESSIRGSMVYLSSLSDFWIPKVAPPDSDAFDPELALKAGSTEFQFLKK